MTQRVSHDTIGQDAERRASLVAQPAAWMEDFNDVLLVVPALRCPCAPLSLRSVVPALRCPCAPLSLRSVVPALLLTALLSSLLSSCPAFAGSYVLSCTGGTDATAGFPSEPYRLNGNTYGGVGGINNPGCSGAISATLTWQPAQGQTLQTDPAPPAGSVIIVETCSATSLAVTTPSGTATAKCDDGFGLPDSKQSASGVPVYNTATPPQVIYSATNPSVTDTRYTTNGGAVISLPAVNASASASVSPYEQASASVSYTVNAYPVTITLNGALADSNHNLNILVGQQCEGILNAGPCNLSSFQWTVPGVTFDHFYISSDQSQGYLVFIDPSIWTTANPFWHWSSSGSYAVSATAQASINGQSLGQVTAQKSITVVTPPQVVNATPGISSFETSNGTVTAIQAGPSGGSGMLIDSVVMTPNPFAQFGYYGSYYNVQLTKELRDISSGSFSVPFITNGFVLDNQDPYNGSQSAYEPGTVNPIPLELSDNPDQGVSDFNGVNIADEFKSYLMYLPPSNGLDEQPVPIHLTQWDWTASAAMNNGIWAPTPPGSCTITSDGSSTEFPSWYASFTNKPGNSERRTSTDPLYPFDMFSFYKADALSHIRH